MVVLAGFAASAQDGFVIEGRMKVENGGLNGAQIIIEKDGKRVQTLEADSRFTFELDFQAVYIVSFAKDGYVTKRLRFDTHVAQERIEYGFLPFEFVVAIFKQYEGVNTVVFNQPVGMISYSETVDEFDYDTDYTKSIQAQIEAIQEQIEEKIEEEAREMEDEAKREEKLEKDVSNYSSSGSKNMNSGEFDEAIKDFEKALELKPDDPELKGLLEEAKKGLADQNQKEADQKKVDDLLAQAEGASEKRQFPEAVDLLKEAQKLQPDNKEVNKLLNSVNDKIEEEKQNEQKFNTLLDQAKQELANKNFKGAEDLINDALDLRPGDNAATDIQTQITAAVGQMEQEERQRKEQQEQFDDKVAAADDLFDDGKFEDAIKQYKAAVGIMEDDGIRNKITEAENALTQQKQQAVEEEKRKQETDDLLTEVENLLKEDQLDQAKTKLEAVKVLSPDDARIGTLEKTLDSRSKELANAAADQEKQQKEFDDLIAEADAALQEKDFDTAEKKYNAAQALMGDDPRPGAGLTSIKEAKEQAKAAEAAEEAKKAQQLNEVLNAAKDLVASGQLAEAKTKLDEAKVIDPDDGRIEEISESIKAKEKEIANQAAEQEKQQKEFEDLLAAADKALTDNDLDLASEKYNAAKTLNPNDPRPETGLNAVNSAREQAQAADAEAAEKQKQIDDLINASKERLAADDLAQAQTKLDEAKALAPKDNRIGDIEKAIQDRLKEFEDLLADADKALGNKDLDEAEEKYNAAKTLNPNDPRPETGLKAVNSAREQAQAADAEAAEKQKQIDDLINASKERLAADDLAQAQTKLDEVKALAPNDKRIGDIEKSIKDRMEDLADAAAEGEKLKQEFENLLSEADAALQDKNYDRAEEKYIAAQAIDEGDARPTDGLAAVKTAREKELAANAANEERQKQFDDLVDQADLALTSSEYENAKTLYEQALAIMEADDARKGLEKAEKGIQDAQAGQLAEEEQRKQFDQFIAASEEMLTAGNLEEAEKNVKNAQKLFDESPVGEILDRIQARKDEIAQEQSAQAEEQQAEQAEAEKRAEFDELISSAQDLLANDKLEKAETAANEAKEIFDEPAVGELLAAIEKRRGALAQSELDAQANAEALAEQKKKEGYDNLIAAADASFDAGNYKQAKKEYENASSMIPEETYPVERISEIETLLKEQANSQQAEAEAAAKEERYNDIIKDADKAFEKGKLDDAETAYKEALSVKDEDYPKAQIKAIADQRKASQDAAAAEGAAQVQEAIDEEYNALINAADKAFEKGELGAAENDYEKALGVKDEQYPKDQLERIKEQNAALAAEAAANDAEAKQQADDERYADLIKQGDDQFEDKAWAKAIEAYNDALTIKNEDYPKEQIDLADARLKEEAIEAAENEQKAQFDALVEQGDKAFQANQLPTAKENFEQALQLYDDSKVKGKLDRLNKILETRAKAAAEALTSAESSAANNEIAGIIQDESSGSPAQAKKSSGVVVSEPRALGAAAAKLNEDQVYDGIQKRVEAQDAEAYEEYTQQELAKQYPDRKTVRTEEQGNSVVTFVYINSNGYVTVYKKVEHNWGGVYFFVDGRSTSGRFWDHETQ